MPDREKSFQLRVGELSEELLTTISRAIYDYTIPLGLNNDLVGSGSLVTIDDSFGILTGAHVITATGWNNSIGIEQTSSRRDVS